MVKLKRIYERAEVNDGFRVLVDRLWPRGVSKEKAELDLWLKDIAPSSALRKWFGHEPKRWLAFQEKYKSEIMANKETFNQLKEIARKRKNITLLYASRDKKHNGAAVVRSLLSNKYN